MFRKTVQEALPRVQLSQAGVPWPPAGAGAAARVPVSHPAQQCPMTVQAPLPPDLFVHHVLFYAPAEATEADQAALLEGLRKLRGIPSLLLAHIGTPAATTRAVIERTYTYSWLCLFATAADEERYQRHPIHDAFRTNCARYWETVVIYDAVGTTV